MILRQSVMLSYIFWKAHYHGRGSPEGQRRRNTQILKKRRRKLPSKRYAKINRMKSKSLCTTVEVWASLKTPTTATSSVYSKGAWRGMATILRTLTSSGIKIVSCLRKKTLRDRCLMLFRKSQPTKLERRMRLINESKSDILCLENQFPSSPLLIFKKH